MPVKKRNLCCEFSQSALQSPRLKVVSLAERSVPGSWSKGASISNSGRRGANRTLETTNKKLPDVRTVAKVRAVGSLLRRNDRRRPDVAFCRRACKGGLIQPARSVDRGNGWRLHRRFDQLLHRRSLSQPGSHAALLPQSAPAH